MTSCEGGHRAIALDMEYELLQTMAVSATGPEQKAAWWRRKADLFRHLAADPGADGAGLIVYAEACEQYAADIERTGRMDLPSPPHEPLQEIPAGDAVMVQHRGRTVSGADLDSVIGSLLDGVDVDEHGQEIQQAANRRASSKGQQRG